MKERLLLLFLLIWIVPPTHSQPLCNIEHYSIDDGLAQGVVMSIIQDQKGYMWFATWNGLNKFDGYSFQTFKANSGNDCPLDNNRIEYIVNGKCDWIWCRTYDQKAYVFNPGTLKFTNVLESFPLKDSQVRRINALRKGVVWLICDKGYCYRIDETACQHTNLTPQPFHIANHKLNGRIIYNILQDDDEDEWILTDKGATIVGKKKILSTLPFEYMQEVDNEIWLATDNGKLAKYNKQTENISLIALPMPSATISAINKVGNHTLVIGTKEHGLILYNTINNSFKQIDIRTPLQTSNEIQSLYVDKHDIIWIFTAANGVTKWDNSKQELLYLPPLPYKHTEDKYNSFYFIFEDCNDQLWIHPKGGNFNYYDRKNDKLQYFCNNPQDNHSILNASIHSYYTDRQGNLWLNTSDRSLYKIDFPHIPHSIIDLSVETRAFLQINDQLWIASKDKKVRIYNANGQLQGYLSPNGQITKTDCTFNENIYCMTKMKDGSIWLGSKFNGLYVLSQKIKNSDKYEIQHYKHTSSDLYSISHNDIYSIYQDSQNHIWIGCFGGGINLVKQTPDKRLKFINSNNELKKYPQNYSKVRCVSETSNGIIMIGTTKGLVCFSSQFKYPEDILYYTHVRNPQNPSSLSNNNVSNIYTNRKKETFISTLGGGINKIISTHPTPDKLLFKSYSQQAGLTSDWVLSSIEDANGDLWIISENTLSKFDPDTATFDNYDRSLLKHTHFYSEAISVIDSKGILWLGTNEGIIRFPIERIHKSNFRPSIVLTNIKILNDSTIFSDDNLSQIILKPHQRNLTVEFAALDYVNPHNISYAYKLDGLETDWNYVGKKRSASYINLPHGQYNLLIKSTNSDEIWTDNIYTLPINVLPKFKETGWAWLLYILLFIALVSIIVYILLYIFRLRHQVDMEQQIANIKLRFFTDISHELRTPLTLIVGPVAELLKHEELSKKAKEHLSLVQKNADRMLQLVNQILDFRKIQNKKMKLMVEKTDIIQFIPTIMEHFYLIAQEKNIDFQFITDTDSLFLWIDKDKFEKIVFNLLSNAFKYTPNDKSITLKVELQHNSANISVIDQGPGISANKINTIFQRFETMGNRNLLEPSSGIGLSLVKELVGMHHGSITVTSTLQKGSVFKVSIPQGKSHLLEDAQIEFILSDNKTIPDNTQENSDIETTCKENNQNTLLIVEDNLELRGFLKEMLLTEFQIIEAGNGSEGYEKTKQFLPDIIVSDVMMPVMDGLDMVKLIKEDKETCHIPIVLLSAKSSLDDRIKGIEQGIDDYITKPFSTTYLKVRITSLIRQRKLLQENFRQNLLSKDPSADIRHELSPADPQLTPYDEQFIEQMMNFMEENMSNSELTVEDIATALAMGRTVFYKKIKSIIGLSPIDFISEIRIKRAVQIFDSGEQNIAQVAFMTGFDDPKYFSRCFKKQVGITPTQYKKQKNNF